MHSTRGVDGLYPEKNALVYLYIQHDLGYGEDIRNKLTVHNTAPTSKEVYIYIHI
jgi:hypothetical protein